MKSVRLVRMGRSQRSKAVPRPARCKLHSLYTRRKIARGVDHAARPFRADCHSAAVIVEFMVVVMRVGIKNIPDTYNSPLHHMDCGAAGKPGFAGCAAG